MYKVVDSYEIEETRVVSEKELRNMYKEDVKETLFNWKDCKDGKILNNLMEELASVYTCDISLVIIHLKEDMGYIIEKEN